MFSHSLISVGTEETKLTQKQNQISNSKSNNTIAL